MMHPIPAPGYTLADGERPPSPHWGDKVYCQLRSGWCDMHGPWKVETTDWIWDGSDCDVVAIRAAN